MSIYSKIRIIFFVSVLFVTAFFGASFYIQKGEHLQQIQKRYMQTSLFIHKYFRKSKRDHQEPDFKLFLQESSFKLITDPKKERQIRKDGHVVMKKQVLRSKFKILRIQNKLYLSLHHPRFQVLLEDKQVTIAPWQLLGWYFLSLLFLLGLYFWLTKSLKPLKTLQRQIQKVAEGDLSVSVRSQNHDEIAEVANAFDDALRKLESLINSRQLFLRTIMHELKTPIGKGKLLNTFLEDEKLEEGYDAVFERLELLIDEFSKIEQMLSSSYALKLASYNAKDLIEQALELMIMDETQIEKQVTIVEKEPLIVHTDFKLFALALKNLIDNAIKYAPDHKVIITITKESMVLANKGVQFTESLDTYAKPFHGKGHGLGLGLYIVQNIMEILKLDLEYTYSNAENVFTIMVPTKELK
jgi:two-component system OmpR family sensor kinase